MNSLSRKLINITSQSPNFSSLQTEVKTICNHLDYPKLRIPVFAPFNHGKSTLLNALLGSRSLPVDLLPTTGAAIILQHGENLQTCIRLKFGRETWYDGTEVLQEYAILDGDRHMREDVESIKVNCPHPLLGKGVELIDLPGTSDMEAQDELVFNQLLSADLVISVLDARKLLTMGEIDKLQEWLLQRGIKTAIFVLNFTNMIEQVEDQKEIASRARFIAREFRGNLPNNISNLYRVDALPALRARVKGDNTLAVQSGIVAFENAIHQITDLLLPQLEQVRMPRVYAIGDRVKQSLELELQALKSEVSVIDRDRNIEIERGRQASNQLKQAFDGSIEILNNWLEIDRLINSYLSQIVSALEEDEFRAWETGDFKDHLKSLEKDINKYIKKACKLINEEERPKISISFPADPDVDLPDKPSSSVGNAGSVAGGAVIGGILGSVIPGIGTWIGASIGASLSHSSSEDAKKQWSSYYSKCSAAYRDAARDYLSNFSRDAKSELSNFKEEAAYVFNYTSPAESSIIRDKRKSLSQLQSSFNELSTALKQTV